jgi:hypothetical protein
MSTLTTTAPDVFPADVDPDAIRPEDLPPDGYGDLDEIAEFEDTIARYRAGEVSEDDFKPLRLFYGTYGIRDSDTHMLRVKTPLGRFDPVRFEAMAVISERYSRGWGHVTTRQNFQFHFVPLDDVPSAMRICALAGLTTREACGNAVRNVSLSPLAGVHPDEVVDVQAAADEVVRHLLRHPAYQLLPRKFKIAFAADPSDDAGTGFHDVGVVPKGRGRRARLPHRARRRARHDPAGGGRAGAVHPRRAAAADGRRGPRRVRGRRRAPEPRARPHEVPREEARPEAFLAKVHARRAELVADGLVSQVVPHPVVPGDEVVALPEALPAELAATRPRPTPSVAGSTPTSSASAPVTGSRCSPRSTSATSRPRSSAGSPG